MEAFIAQLVIQVHLRLEVRSGCSPYLVWRVRLCPIVSGLAALALASDGYGTSLVRRVDFGQVAYDGGISSNRHRRSRLAQRLLFLVSIFSIRWHTITIGLMVANCILLFVSRWYSAAHRQKMRFARILITSLNIFVLLIIH